MLVCKNISKKFGKIQILKDISLKVEKGELTALIGPNSSGKTTLLKILSGVLSPDEGEIYLEGKNISKMKEVERARRIRYLSYLNPAGSISVLNLLLLSRFSLKGYLKPFSRDDFEAVRGAGEFAGISHLLQRDYLTLSSGEKMRFVLAEALSGEADYLLFDEPNSFLDIKWELFLFEKLNELTKMGKTVLLVTHNLNAVIKKARSVIVMKDGKIIAQGKVEKIFDENLIKDIFEVECRIDRENKNIFLE